MARRDPSKIIILPGPWRIICTVLAVFPIPGIGAIIAGIKNPHARLLQPGIAQTVLVVFGSWPLVIPGVAGLIWAAFTAYRIHTYSVPAPPWSNPVAVDP